MTEPDRLAQFDRALAKMAASDDRDIAAVAAALADWRAGVPLDAALGLPPNGLDAPLHHPPARRLDVRVIALGASPGVADAAATLHALAEATGCPHLAAAASWLRRERGGRPAADDAALLAEMHELLTDGTGHRVADAARWVLRSRGSCTPAATARLRRKYRARYACGNRIGTSFNHTRHGTGSHTRSA